MVGLTVFMAFLLFSGHMELKEMAWRLLDASIT